METSARVLNILVRVCGGIALALGLAFWLGYAHALTRLHIGLGIALVFALWVLAGLALKATTHHGIAVFAAAWGVVSWIFGYTQNQILPGSSHWVIEVAHLAIGIATIAIGGRLASIVASARRTST